MSTCVYGPPQFPPQTSDPAPASALQCMLDCIQPVKLVTDATVTVAKVTEDLFGLTLTVLHAETGHYTGLDLRLNIPSPMGRHVSGEVKEKLHRQMDKRGSQRGTNKRSAQQFEN